MLKIITTLTMAAIGLLAQAQVSETRTTSLFDKIEVTNGIELVYGNGSHQPIKAEAINPASLANVTTVIKNNTLYVSKSAPMEGTAKVYVWSPAIKSLKGDLGARITIANRVQGDEVLVSLAGGSIFTGSIEAERILLKAKSFSTMNARVDAKSLEANFKGSAKINLSGNADNASVAAVTGAYCNARNFITGNVDVNAGSNASVAISAPGKLSVNVAETARVTYFGTPERVRLQKEALTIYRHNVANGLLITEN